MGTRNLTSVIKDEKTVIAQYGQWDGYPGGQGLTALNFLKNRSLKKFRKKLELVRFATDEDEKEVQTFMESIGADDGWMTMDQAGLYHKKYPLLTRDNGAEILQMIHDNNEPVFLTDSSEFIKDGLFCEWAYVIDLDKETFEVYSGGLVKSYSLSELPGPAAFVKECDPLEEEDDE